jgi:hypothetical protein
MHWLPMQQPEQLAALQASPSSTQRPDLHCWVGRHSVQVLQLAPATPQPGLSNTHLPSLQQPAQVKGPHMGEDPPSPQEVSNASDASSSIPNASRFMVQPSNKWLSTVGQGKRNAQAALTERVLD